MPVCRYCGARISKFDNDMCPVCGTKKPLEGVRSETVEITTEINTSDPSFNNYKVTKRSTACLYFSLLGIFGCGFFYTKRNKIGVIWLISNIVFIAGLGSILAFLTPLSILWGYLICLFIAYAINIAVGLYHLFKDNLKDGNGEFMH